MANKELIVKGRLSSLSDREMQNDDGTTTKRRLATLVFDKSEFGEHVEAIDAAIKAAMTEEFGKIVKPKHKILKDGDTETREDTDNASPTFGETILIKDSSPHLAGAYYMTGINADKLVMYNSNKRVISWEDFLSGDQDIYVGCYVQAKLNLSVYQNKYGIMVSKYLNAMAFYRDGDRIVGSGGRSDHSADGFTFANANTDDKNSFL